MRKKSGSVWSLTMAFFLLLFLGAWLPDCNEPGSLTKVTATSKVGVLLDEIPAGSVRESIASELLAKPDSFWIDRAHEQLHFSHYRLIYLGFFYVDEDPNTPAGSLPLPPDDVWDVDLDGMARRETVDGHDYVLIDYDFEGWLLSRKDSPGEVVPALGNVGGVYDELLIFPIDPTLVLQRTGNACVDEWAYPPRGYDGENLYLFYDQDCMADTSTPWCHLTNASEGCVEALDAHVGRVDVNFHYERKPWDPCKADEVRVQDLPTVTGADLVVRIEDPGLEVNRVVYQYFEGDACELEEACIGGTGWRRLLQFTSVDHNIGAGPMEGGNVDDALDEFNWFHFNECHQHMHFEHYGDFSFDDPSGADLGSKLSFCLESTNRLSNNEATPLMSYLQGCIDQGIESGFGDQYQAGLPCQHVDVTDVPAGTFAIGNLTSTVNPDDLLCEGTVERDALGNMIWVPSGQTTPEGEDIWMPECNESPGAYDNNHQEFEVILPPGGEGYVTDTCAAGQVGPLRDCGLEYLGVFTCTPGDTVTHAVTPGLQLQPVVRICESSHALGVGTACAHREAIANEMSTSVTFTCPQVRDAPTGTGGYSVYLGDIH